jgi:methanogenic corrinoid protein MtbC1
VKAALESDLATATTLTTELMNATTSRTDVMTDLFDAAQQYTAERWLVGEATAADEFRVSRAIASAMQALPEPPPPPPHADSVLLMTISPERHHLGLDLVAMALAEDGWNVETGRHLELDNALERLRVGRFGLVGISSTYLSKAARSELTTIVAASHALGRPVIVGGNAFLRAPKLAVEINADVLAADAREAVVFARRLTATYRKSWWGGRRHAAL